MSAFQSSFKKMLAGHGCHRRLVVVFRFLGYVHLGTIDFDGVKLRGVKHILFPFDLWGLVGGGGFSLSHFTAALEYRTRFDHQRGGLDVSRQFRGPTQLDPIAGNDVPGYDSMNCGDRDLNICINLASGTNNQVATGRSDATRKAAVHTQHRFK